MSKKNCKHAHQCDQCVRDEIAILDKKIAELNAERVELNRKLPYNTSTTINICNHGCHGICHHYTQYQPYQYLTPYANAVSTTGLNQYSLSSSTGANLLQQYQQSKGS